MIYNSNRCDKCCSKCMDKMTHLCLKSCFYNADSNCKTCKFNYILHELLSLANDEVPVPLGVLYNKLNVEYKSSKYNWLIGFISTDIYGGWIRFEDNIEIYFVPFNKKVNREQEHDRNDEIIIVEVMYKMETLFINKEYCRM